MMPFPAIFKAKCLSKAWLARFLSISSQDDEEKKGLAISFQRRVREWSRNWETFYPVFAGENDFVAYDIAYRNCRRMPSLSYLPDNVMDRSFLEAEGALLYGYGKLERGMCEETGSCKERGSYDLYVTNFITRTWKRLPPPPTVSLPKFRRKKLVTDESLETYKLILIRASGRYEYLIDIYDSQSNSWSSKDIVSNLVFNFYFDTVSPVYVDGVLYIVNSERPQQFRAINLEEGTMGELTLSFHDVRKMSALGLTVWKGNVLVIVIEGGFGTLRMLKILQVDMVSLRLIEVARYPTPDSYGNAPPVSSGRCIFFNCGSEVLLYNFHDDEWSYFPFPTDERDKEYVWLKGACRPGLSPFLEV